MAVNEFLKRSCPTCGSSHIATTGTVRSRVQAEQLEYAALAPYWNGILQDKLFFSYERCAECNLLYAPTFFNDQQLESLYRQMPPNMEEVPLDALKKTQRGYFNVLKKHARLEGSYLEIGPDIGLFTENCSREGNFDSYWLFEPNRDVAPALAATVAGRDVHIIHEMFGFSHVPENSISTAVIIHVLDHLLDPVETLKALKPKLAANARVLIVTHDESSLLRKVVRWRWPAFCLQHPELYNPKTIRGLMQAAGYDVVKQEKTVNHFQLGFLVKHLVWALGFKPKWLPGFGQLTLGLKLGNMLTIATPRGN